LFHVAADRAFRQPQFLRDGHVAQAVQLAVEEGGLDDLWQAIDGTVDGDQRFDQQQLFFGRGGQRFGQQGQALDIGQLELAPPMTIENQSPGDGRQIRTRLFDAVGINPRRQQLAKGVGGGVLGVRVIAQALLDMLQQPAVMVAEKEAQLAGRRGLHRSAFQM